MSGGGKWCKWGGIEIWGRREPENILSDPSDAVLRHSGKHRVPELVEAKSRGSRNSISNLVWCVSWESNLFPPWSRNQFRAHQSCGDSSGDRSLRCGWVKVEHSGGVQIVNCVTEEKRNAGVQNLEKRGKLIWGQCSPSPSSFADVMHHRSAREASIQVLLC